MAIITRQTALRLVRDGKATEEGLTCTGGRWPEGEHFVVVTRHDLQRTDHYRATEADERRLRQ